LTVYFKFSEAKVRPFTRACVRFGLIALFALGMWSLPARAASVAPVGQVVTAQNARLGNVSAARGIDLYPGDALTTDTNGSLRLRVGAGQVYLLASSAATLTREQNQVQAKLDHGTLGFSTSEPAQLAIATPAGVLRGAGQGPIFGQVAMLSPTRIRVSSYQGTLLVKASDGTERAIAPGETYEATLAPNAGQDNSGVVSVGGGSHWNWKKFALIGGALAGAGVGSYLIYDEVSESCSKPDNC
jgi:hypothetical protein